MPSLRPAAAVRLAALAVALVMALAPVGRAAAAGFAWGAIECCCGEHAGDEACGCKDCPAVHADAPGDDHDGDAPPEEEGDQDGAPGLSACGPRGDLVTFAPGDAPLAAPALVLDRPRASPAAPPPPPPRPASHTVEPETPPF